jgi:hypothetical protein
MVSPLNIHRCTPTCFPIVSPSDAGISSDSEDNVSVSTFDTSLASEVDSVDLDSSSNDGSTASDGSPEHDTDLRTRLEVANKVRSNNLLYCHLLLTVRPSSTVNCILPFKTQ